jgi:hypothetical protein
LFLFSIITIVLVLLALEIIFRILFAIEHRGYHTSVFVQGNTLQMSDSALVFKNRPFYLDYYRRFQFNEEGMRGMPGDVFMPKKGPNDYWVFLFGGSAMEGVGSNKDGDWLDITGVMDYRPDETIAGHLQNILQQKMPGKKVRVFNAAMSGGSLWQSMMRYKQLSAKYKMDWVISMDGENEPPALQDLSAHEFIKNRWNESSLFKFPLNVIIPVTSHSAFVNKMKQALFHYKLSGRLERNEREHYPARASWAGAATGTLRFAGPNHQTEKAIREFHSDLWEFDSVLTANRQLHVLYIQPQLAFRDTSVMNTTERALYNYYIAAYNDPFNNSFKQRLYSGQDSLPGGVQILAQLHSWKNQAFVDYCHFTAQANEYAAQIMAMEILKQP